MITEDDAALLADFIASARRSWYAGTAPRPVSLDQGRLAQLERLLRAHPVADVGGSAPIAWSDPGEWISVADGSKRYAVPRRTLTGWVRSGRVRSHRASDGSRAPYLVNRRDLLQLLDPTKENPTVTATDSDRIAALEVALNAVRGTLRDLQQVAERVSDIPAPDSPAQRRERAQHVARMTEIETASQRRHAAQEAAVVRAEAEHYLQLMARIEADPHVQTPQQRLDHAETSRPYDVDALAWQRDRTQPETGCCGNCCPSNHHNHSSLNSWDPATLRVRWTELRTHYQEAVTR